MNDPREQIGPLSVAEIDYELRSRWPTCRACGQPCEDGYIGRHDHDGLGYGVDPASPRYATCFPCYDKELELSRS